MIKVKTGRLIFLLVVNLQREHRRFNTFASCNIIQTSGKFFKISFKKMAGKYKIVMVRHGESEWNLKNQFCGWFDADLSENGKWFQNILVVTK